MPALTYPGVYIEELPGAGHAITGIAAVLKALTN
jgi:hypothetical protein